MKMSRMQYFVYSDTEKLTEKIIITSCSLGLKDLVFGGSLMKYKETVLKISEAFQQDVGYGRARIDHQNRINLDLSIGDIIEIEGTKTTAAVVWRAHPTDEGKGLIRIDNLTRKNAGSGLGERVKIRRAEVREAKEVVLAPLISKGQQIQFGSGIGNLIKKGLLKRPLTKGDSIIIPGIALFGSSLPFIIINTTPGGIVSISEETRITVKEEAAKEIEIEGPRISYEDIGGLHEEILKVREMIELPLKHPELFDRLGIDPPKGVLLHGPPGTGKTLIAKAVANESGANFYTINGPEIMSKFYGQSEENLRKIFEEAEKNAPSIIFIDEIDAIAPKRSEVHGEVERRVVSQMLTLMDGLKGRGKLIVIGATNIPDTLDPALRRPGRFDREIRIDAPDRDGRKEILQIHTRGMPLYHYDVSVAGERVIKDIDNHKKNTNEKIALNEEKIKQSQKEIKEKEEEITETYKELEELQENAKYEEESFLGRILKAIKNKKSDIDILKDKISDLKSGVKKLDDEIDKLQRDIKIVKKTKEKLDKNKNLLNLLLNEINELSEVFHKRNVEDTRNIFTEREILTKNDELKRVVKSLVETEIISKNFYNEVERLSADKMKEALADITYGYVGADLAALARESAMNALRRYLPEIDLEKPIPTEILEKMEVTIDDFKSAHRGIEPSALREFFIEIPKVTWDDVGGLEEIKQQLQEAVEWPLTQPEVFKRMGIEPPRGILLYGPPGTGKTLLAKAVAHESKANFISVKGPEVLSKWVGESEKAVRELFKKARQVAPTIVLLDEIDSIAPRRGMHSGSHVTESVVNQILTSMDGLESMDGVVIIGATNKPDLLDPALLRPGRFDRLLLTPAPDKKSRFEIFKIHTKGIPITVTKEEIKEIEQDLKSEFSEITSEGSYLDIMKKADRGEVLSQAETDKLGKTSGLEKNKSSKTKQELSVAFKKLSGTDKLNYWLATKTDGFSGADIEGLCREAAMLALRNDIKADEVNKNHFEKAMHDMGPSITKELINHYKKLKESRTNDITKDDKKDRDVA